MDLLLDILILMFCYLYLPLQVGGQRKKETEAALVRGSIVAFTLNSETLMTSFK